MKNSEGKTKEPDTFPLWLNTWEKEKRRERGKERNERGEKGKKILWTFFIGRFSCRRLQIHHLQIASALTRRTEKGNERGNDDVMMTSSWPDRCSAVVPCEMCAATPIALPNKSGKAKKKYIYSKNIQKNSKNYKKNFFHNFFFEVNSKYVLFFLFRESISKRVSTLRVSITSFPSSTPKRCESFRIR